MVSTHEITGFTGNGIDEISAIVVFKDPLYNFISEKKYTGTIEQLNGMTLIQIKDYIMNQITAEKLAIDNYNVTLSKLQNALNN